MKIQIEIPDSVVTESVENPMIVAGLIRDVLINSAHHYQCQSWQYKVLRSISVKFSILWRSNNA